MKFDRDTYFDRVREHPFDGEMTQQQVNGQNALLDAWEKNPTSDDLRHFAYMMATTFHETARTMMPIEEYGKGAGHEYGRKDGQTHQTYYGRGYVQLTWRDNYARATRELNLKGDDDLEWHADRALDAAIAYRVMSHGMMSGWFTGKSLPQYFNHGQDDPVGARQIINPDDKGPLIAGYYNDFLGALDHASQVTPTLEPAPAGAVIVTIRIDISATPGVRVVIEGESNGEANNA